MASLQFTERGALMFASVTLARFGERQRTEEGASECDFTPGMNEISEEMSRGAEQRDGLGPLGVIRALSLPGELSLTYIGCSTFSNFLNFADFWGLCLTDFALSGEPRFKSFSRLALLSVGFACDLCMLGRFKDTPAPVV
jgi:hypothetical protein